MKRTAHFLLLLSIVSTFVYSVVGFYLNQFDKNEKHWVDNIENTNATHFKVLKLNASLYSFIEDTDIEYVNENIVFHNKVYHVFKKQILNNILHLYYLPNHIKTAQSIHLNKLVDAELDENSSSNKNPLEKIIKSFIKEYTPSTISDFKMPFLSQNTILSHNKKYDVTTSSGYINNLFTPPNPVRL
jgi:hypothetical protein